MRVVTLLVISMWLLSACAGRSTVSENQCVAGDWQTLGYRDGVNGYRSSRLLEHQDACGKSGIVPDRTAYMTGWDEGAREYCEPNNGFSVGERGWQHNNICPSELRGSFLHAYNEGRSLYQARSDVLRLEQELEHKTARVANLKSQIVAAIAAQLEPQLSVSERVQLGTSVQRLHEEQRRLNAEIPALERELATRSRELDRLNQTLAGVTY